MTKLLSLFDEVKKAFFPGWDSTNKWQVGRKKRLSEGFNGEGLCNKKTKTIEISRNYEGNDDEIRSLLCHEICHAICGGGHGQIWNRRLLRVADRAADLGQFELATLIREDIKMGEIAQTPRLADIQNSIEDALLIRPDASFEAVIEWEANNWSLTSAGLLNRYKNLRRFFDKTKRYVLSLSVIA